MCVYLRTARRNLTTRSVDTLWTPCLLCPRSMVLPLKRCSTLTCKTCWWWFTSPTWPARSSPSPKSSTFWSTAATTRLDVFFLHYLPCSSTPFVSLSSLHPAIRHTHILLLLFTLHRSVIAYHLYLSKWQPFVLWINYIGSVYCMSFIVMCFNLIKWFVFCRAIRWRWSTTTMASEVVLLLEVHGVGDHGAWLEVSWRHLRESRTDVSDWRRCFSVFHYPTQPKGS